MQIKTFATLTVQFSSHCLCTLPGVHHIWPFSFHWPPHTFLQMEMLTWWIWSSFFIHDDQSTMSGLRLVETMSGNYRYFSQSTASCQSWLWSKFPEILPSCLDVVVWLSLTKYKHWFFASFLCLSTISEPGCVPCARAIGHAVRIFLHPNMGKAGVSDRDVLMLVYSTS